MATREQRTIDCRLPAMAVLSSHYLLFSILLLLLLLLLLLILLLLLLQPPPRVEEYLYPITLPRAPPLLDQEGSVLPVLF